MRAAPFKESEQARGVLILVENLPVPFDRRVWQEATALREAGYRVSVICPKGRGYGASYEEIDGIYIYRHSLPIEASGAPGYLLEYASALFWEFSLSLKVLHQRGFDVIQACNPPDLLFLVAAFHKIVLGKKFLFDQHDVNPELYEIKFGRKDFLHRLLLRFERWTFRWADASLAPNERFRQIAMTRGGMPSGRVWVVKSYPDLTRFRGTAPDMKVKRGFTYLVGYVGVIAQQDGVDLLIGAMAHIVNELKRTDVGCLVIGDGPEWAKLVNLARERGVEQYVEFCGFRSGRELLSRLSSLDLGVIPDPPNVCNDMLSMNKVFEYMALGLPIIQFDLAQSRSEAGEAALVVGGEAAPETLAEGIVALLADEPKRQRMSAYGRERARSEFRWEKEKTSLLAAYEALFARTSR